jgi:hypothetical protein
MKATNTDREWLTEERIEVMVRMSENLDYTCDVLEARIKRAFWHSDLERHDALLTCLIEAEETKRRLLKLLLSEKEQTALKPPPSSAPRQRKPDLPKDPIAKFNARYNRNRLTAVVAIAS